VERELATDIFWTVASPETCEALVMRRAREPDRLAATAQPSAAGALMPGAG
jgi:hypothetical protein